MKSLYESLLDDEEEIFDRHRNMFLIKSWIQQNYTKGGLGKPVEDKDIIIRQEGSKYIVDIACDRGRGYLDRLRLNSECESLTNDLFEFGEVFYFGLEDSNITSLKGMPRKFNYLNANRCNKLKEVDFHSEMTDLDNARVLFDECKSLTKINISGSIRELNCGDCPNLTSIRVENIFGVSAPHNPKLESLLIAGRLTYFDTHESSGTYILTETCPKLKSIICKPECHFLRCSGCKSLEVIEVEMCKQFTRFDLSKCKSINKWPKLGEFCMHDVTLDGCITLNSLNQLYGTYKLKRVGKSFSLDGCTNLEINDVQDLPLSVQGYFKARKIKSCLPAKDLWERLGTKLSKILL